MPWVYAIFVVSGFSALLYQVVWQRALYAIYGINVESVTVIVTAFMLGLGVGSLAGGAVSKNPRRPALLLFALVELGIGAFGALSLALFRAVGALTLAWGPVSTAGVTFLLVLVPTTLMGATLPLLVAHAVRASGNVGRSVGALYFVNTLGSALASLAAVFCLLGALGMSRTVALAAALNFTVSALAWVQHARTSRSRVTVAARMSPAREPAQPARGSAPQA
jgi:predicted membrane-bound spermidine synthase